MRTIPSSKPWSIFGNTVALFGGKEGSFHLGKTALAPSLPSQLSRKRSLGTPVSSVYTITENALSENRKRGGKVGDQIGWFFQADIEAHDSAAVAFFRPVQAGISHDQACYAAPAPSNLEELQRIDKPCDLIRRIPFLKHNRKQTG